MSRAVIERCAPLLVFTLSLGVARAYAHDSALAPPWSALAWTSNLWLGLALALSATAYILGDLRCERHARSQRRLWFERAAFVLAWIAILAALISPIDRLSDISFWAHMLQHEVL